MGLRYNGDDNTEQGLGWGEHRQAQEAFYTHY